MAMRGATLESRLRSWVVAQILFQGPKGFSNDNPLLRNPCPNAQVPVPTTRDAIRKPKDEALRVGGGVVGCTTTWHRHSGIQIRHPTAPSSQRSRTSLNLQEDVCREPIIYEKGHVGPSATPWSQNHPMLASARRKCGSKHTTRKGQNRPWALTISEGRACWNSRQGVYNFLESHRHQP